MPNSLLLDFAEWLGATSFSVGLHESFYLFNWLETTHVLTLMLSLGMLFVIDARMMGWWFTGMPVSLLAERLKVPMWIGFTIMFVTGLTLYTAIPVRYTTSIWFRIKLILLFVAAINAWTFHRHMSKSAAAWDRDTKPPRRTRMAALASIGLWAVVIVCGRFIAYDWFDCGPELSGFMNWATGCVAMHGEH